MQLMVNGLNNNKNLNSDEILLKVAKKQNDYFESKAANDDSEVKDYISLNPKSFQNPYKNEKLL